MVVERRFKSRILTEIWGVDDMDCGDFVMDVDIEHSSPVESSLRRHLPFIPLELTLIGVFITGQAPGHSTKAVEVDQSRRHPAAISS